MTHKHKHELPKIRGRPVKSAPEDLTRENLSSKTFSVILSTDCRCDEGAAAASEANTVQFSHDQETTKKEFE